MTRVIEKMEYPGLGTCYFFKENSKRYLHREDGPALIRLHGTVHEWWEDGSLLKREWEDGTIVHYQSPRLSVEEIDDDYQKYAKQCIPIKWENKNDLDLPPSKDQS